LNPAASTRLASAHAFAAASALARVSANGLSTKTCLPARAAAMTCSACCVCGVASTIASMLGSASAFA